MFAWLRKRGAETIGHPGGTLYAHLGRVHDRLVRLGLGTAVQLAGLTHAAYGTDGFDVALLDRAERLTLRGLVGEDAERLVYRYGACDRRRSWDQLAGTGRLVDRFTGAAEVLTGADLRSLVDLSVINELDVVENDPTAAGRFGAYLRELFAAWAPVASPQVNAEARRVLRRYLDKPTHRPE